MTIGFEEALTLVGLLLIAGAMVSGLVHRTVLSLTVLTVAAGAVASLTGILQIDPGAEVIIVVVEIVLLLTLSPTACSSSRRCCASSRVPPCARWRSRCRSTRSCWHASPCSCSPSSAGARRCCSASCCRRPIPS